jgi:hypothetical protein
MIKKPLKIVVFDLDETLGYFTEFGIFCDCLNKYFKTNEYSNTKFNELLDLYPAFLRPKIMNILRYLKSKKSENKCYKVMIYTNNQGDKSWAINIKKYFENKIDCELFDKIIAAFKVRGKHVELGRTTQDKTMDDFIRCTKLPDNIEVCFIDDLYHSGMETDNVYYIHVKPYKHQLSIDKMTSIFLNSSLGRDIQEKEVFINSIKNEFNKYDYKVSEKSPSEQEIDDIIGKRMLQHLKQFFYENTSRTVKRKHKPRKNHTVKRHK